MTKDIEAWGRWNDMSDSQRMSEWYALRARLAEAERWIRYWMPDPSALHAYYQKPFSETEAFLAGGSVNEGERHG